MAACRSGDATGRAASLASRSGGVRSGGGRSGGVRSERSAFVRADKVTGGISASNSAMDQNASKPLTVVTPGSRKEVVGALGEKPVLVVDAVRRADDHVTIDEPGERPAVAGRLDDGEELRMLRLVLACMLLLMRVLVWASSCGQPYDGIWHARLPSPTNPLHLSCSLWLRQARSGSCSLPYRLHDQLPPGGISAPLTIFCAAYATTAERAQRDIRSEGALMTGDR